jgi:hypothetical protein
MEQRHAEDRVGPTPETARKLRADVVFKLHAAGRLRNEQKLAAEHIRDLLSEIERAMYPARVMDGTQSIKVVGRVSSSPLERMAPAKYRQWRDVYRPWAQEVRAIRTGAGASALTIVVLLVEHNIGTWQIEKLLGLRNGTVLAIVQGALTRYAEIAGWVEKRVA